MSDFFFLWQQTDRVHLSKKGTMGLVQSVYGSRSDGITGGTMGLVQSVHGSRSDGIRGSRNYEGLV